MASPFHCDAEACETQAAQLITKIETGDVLAFCDEHFVLFCLGIADAARAEMADEAGGPVTDPELNGAAPEAQGAEPDEPKSGGEDDDEAADEDEGSTETADTAAHD